MNFANPFMLHGLWLAAAPIVIHLLNRRRTVTVPFSNVGLIQSLQQDRMRRVRLKQWLLLLLRTLIIASLALAFARPTLEGGSGSGQRTTGVVLIDRSLSMAHHGQFERARTRGEEAIRLFDPQDDVHLLAFDTRSESFGDGTLDGARLGLSDLWPSLKGTTAGSGLAAAAESLERGDHPAREVFVLSDFAAEGWRTLSDTLTGFGGATVYALPLRPTGDNLSIASLDVQGGILGVGLRTAIRVTLWNHGASMRAEVPLDVSVDGRRIGRRLVALPPGAQVTVSVPFTPETSGDRVLLAELPDDDELSPDNTRWSVVHVPGQVRVTLVGEEDDVYFIERALAAEGEGASVTRVTPARLSTDAIEASDVIVLASVRSLTRAQVADLVRHVSDGAGVWILMGSGIDADYYTRALFPALLPARVEGLAGRAGSRTYVTLRPPGDSHPVLRGLVDPETFKSPVFRARYRVAPLAGTETPLAYSDGTPALMEATIGRGRVVALTSHTSQTWSDLAVSGLFVPMVHRLTRYLATGTLGRSDYVTGDTVLRPARVSSAGGVDREGQLVTPDGATETIWTDARGSGRVWRLGNVDRAGIYEIRSRGRRVDRLAVNVPASESDTRAIEPESLSGILAGAEVVVVGDETELAEAVAPQRDGREIWRYLLGLALALMIGELWIMSGERRARSGESVDAAA